MAQTFEEWATSRGYVVDEGTNSLLNSMRDAWTAAQFALNTELGITANEAAKVERRKMAMDAIEDAIGPESLFGAEKTVEEIIKEAQG